MIILFPRSHEYKQNNFRIRWRHMDTYIYTIIGSGKGFLPGSTKQLPEPDGIYLMATLQNLQSLYKFSAFRQVCIMMIIR